MRSTWKGCTRTRRWKVSFPAFLVMYLFAAMRAASSASLVICSFSQLHSNRLMGGVLAIQQRIHSHFLMWSTCQATFADSLLLTATAADSLLLPSTKTA